MKEELDKQRELLAATRDRIGAVPHFPVAVPDQGGLSEEGAADDIDSFISKNQQADAQHVCVCICALIRWYSYVCMYVRKCIYELYSKLLIV